MITYDHHELKKTDTWLPHLDSEPYSKFKQFTIEDFSDNREQRQKGPGKGRGAGQRREELPWVKQSGTIAAPQDIRGGR